MKPSVLLLLALVLLPLGCKSGSDKIKADIDRLTRRAERGDARAQYELGALYGSLWNPAEANKWYRRAAERGVADAQYALGVNYANGDGVPKDQIEAYAWFNLAATQGNRLAINARNRIVRTMSRQDIEEGHRRAYQYVTKGAVPKEVIVREIDPENSTNGPALKPAPEPNPPVPKESDPIPPSPEDN